MDTLRLISVIAFDKTGTITTGKPQVADVVLLQGDEATLLAQAASVESGSAHPLARAVVNAARARGLVWPRATQLAVCTLSWVRRRSVSATCGYSRGTSFPHEGATVLVVLNALRLLRFADTADRPGSE